MTIFSKLMDVIYKIESSLTFMHQLKKKTVFSLLH